ncbi:MAG: DNA-directed RNA polymerase subunit alpha [Acidimicrobiaceae bacterium]|nr:DNA-directed RNA polymerase subunit alpha [Acidimicrobiaceae bacterium]
MLVMQRPVVEALEPAAGGNRQQFAIGPLEPGFGHTLGNSLRRTLLSSIPGAAVTQARFDGTLHEFTTISGVVEDVTDIILNLKDLVLVVMSGEPVTLRLDARGPAEVTAGDIQDHPDVKILNPEAPIATINKGGRLALDITVAQGRGYVSAEDNKELTAAIGVIPVDSIYSPVRRVAFNVEATRVEQSTDYDRLVLDVETDGSVSPHEAVASASATLRSLIELLEGLSEAPQGLELAEVVFPSSPDAEAEVRIEDLDLTERPRNCLLRVEINTLNDLLQQTPQELLAITNFGEKSLDEVVAKLDEMGLSLRTPSEDEDAGTPA